MRRREAAIACRELVELVTDYFEGALAPDVRRAVEVHLEDCDDCARAVAQWRRVVDLTGRLGSQEVEQVEEGTRARLLEAFRQGPPTSDA